METIGRCDFNYCDSMVFSAPLDREDPTSPHKQMNKNILSVAVPVSVVAVAAFLLSLRSPVTAESVIGYASVLALLGVAALEYRISWKRLFGRS